MEPEDALTTTENVLRDLIDDILAEKYGPGWIAERVDEGTRERWEGRLAEEKSRRAGANVDERLIYYSELTDLPKILKNDWGAFAPCFGSSKTMELDLKRLITYRHPEHHGRELLPFERHLVLGIAGVIRNKVTMFLSERGPDQEYFPKIEYVTDSFGYVARGSKARVETGLTLHPGDEVTFTCHGWDPKGEPPLWGWGVNPGVIEIQHRQAENEITWRLYDRDVAESQALHIVLLSNRPFHRHQWCDDHVTFCYRVLPRSL